MGRGAGGRTATSKTLRNSVHRGPATAILPLQYSYRASPAGTASYRMLLSGTDCSYRLYAMEYTDVQPVVGELLAECRLPELRRGDVLSVDLTTSVVSRNGTPMPVATAVRSEARKFVAEVQLSADGERYSRLCSHYLPYDRKPIGGDYYFGDDYIDYPRQTATADGVALVTQHCASGRLLDVGCALGLYTAAFLEAGFNAFGMDASEFAIAEAARKVGSERVRCASLEEAGVPFRGDFDVIWMWDVLEHFADPRESLATVSRRVPSGGLLFLHTSNGDSLTHRLFGVDWEGYSDYSHYGVDRVTCASVREWLEELGWDIEDWQCRNIWVEGLDPVPLRLQEVFHSSPELRVLLDEADLGDAIRVVARKT